MFSEPDLVPCLCGEPAVDESCQLFVIPISCDADSKVVTKVRDEDIITAPRAAELLAPLIEKYGVPE
ncbi:hypothetical protein [Rhodococcus opacus]|uniref:Uncharacterized protein n=1 Tax=Rhodococcus opacus TaxID=37919 RepID=A0A076ECP7_RHOOP|nr:hypothetical protein [Rhodococcus opacus]AII03346.1 hypothetical protein EP51_01265 [Rhodococcus opacus]